jgi:hypothetical protein
LAKCAAGCLLSVLAQAEALLPGHQRQTPKTWERFCRGPVGWGLRHLLGCCLWHSQTPVRPMLSSRLAGWAGCGAARLLAVLAAPPPMPPMLPPLLSAACCQGTRLPSLLQANMAATVTRNAAVTVLTRRILKAPCRLW